MDYKFVEKNESTGSQKICFLRKDDISGIETGRIANVRGTGNEPALLDVIIIYTRSMSPITLIFENNEKRDRFLQELTDDFNPKEFQINWKK